MKPPEVTLAIVTDQPFWDARGGAWRAQEKLDAAGRGTGSVEFYPLNHQALSTRGEEGGDARPEPDVDLSFEKPAILADRGGFRLA